MWKYVCDSSMISGKGALALLDRTRTGVLSSLTPSPPEGASVLCNLWLPLGPIPRLLPASACPAVIPYVLRAARHVRGPEGPP